MICEYRTDEKITSSSNEELEHKQDWSAAKSHRWNSFKWLTRKIAFVRLREKSRLFAMELLSNNDIECKTFTNSIKTALEKEYRNIMLTGPTNCRKAFLLNPLNKIYQTFTNPTSSSFARVGTEKAEVIFLNDFRWSPQIIP